MILPFALSLPWLVALAFLLLRARLPRELPAGDPTRWPFVSVVVPARNEAVNIGPCVESLAASSYSHFEIVVVDDGSEDGTADLARAAGAGRARSLRVIAGDPLPEGWLGKAWACAQGAQVAEGELLLFTDADTLHGPDLLARAVAAMEEDQGDLLTVLGRQIMGSFWERLVQPQMFLALFFRFFDVDRAAASGRWRDVIANGQFLLFRRDAYEALGGHAAVRDQIAEDLAFAQIVVRGGRRLRLRMAELELSTRMYRSLGEIVAGWSKNFYVGGVATMPPRLRRFVAPVSTVAGGMLWLAPPVALVAALAGIGGAGLLVWALVTVGASLALWTLFTRRMGAPAAYGLLYPLGAVVGMWIFLRSWWQGRKIAWKGRAYVLRDLSERP